MRVAPPQFTLGYLAAFVCVVALLVGCYVKVKQEGLQYLSDHWPSYTVAVPGTGPNVVDHVRRDRFPNLMLWFGIAALVTVPATAVGITAYEIVAQQPARFLSLFPVAVVALVPLLVVTKLGVINAFWNYSPFCLLLMLLACLFGQVETLCRRLPRSATLACLCGFLASFTCYCLLVTLVRIAGAAS